MSLYRYIASKGLNFILILLGITLLIFLIFNLVSTDPVVMMLGRHSSPGQVANLKHQLGLDKPLYLQYLDIVKSIFTLNFGNSWVTNQKITEMIASSFKVSLILSLPCIFFSTLISLGMAFVSVFFNKKFLYRIISIISVFTMSISGIIYVISVQWLFAYKLNWFEIEGYEYGFPGCIKYIVLPCIVWILVSIGPDTIFYRSLFVSETKKKYVLTAKAMGLSNSTIFFKHIFKNALIPIITHIVNQLPNLLLGAILTESFFGIPGLGSLMLDSINNSDFPTLKALTLLTGVFYVFLNILADIIYSLLDVRISLD